MDDGNDATSKVKVCRGCKESKLYCDFGKNMSYSDGLHRVCKQCARARSRRHYEENKDRCAEKSAAYKIAHRDEIRASTKKWRDENKSMVNEKKRAAWSKKREAIEGDPSVYTLKKYRSVPQSGFSHADLVSAIEYNPDTGRFTWRHSISAHIREGAEAGSINSAGYRNIRIFGGQHLAHRLAFLYMIGEWPSGEIDHINGICDDNRWSNIRIVTHSENQQNRRKSSSNTSGLVGASWNARIGKWHSQIRSNRERIHLGYFDTAEEAASAYANAKKSLHPLSPTVRE